MSGLKLLAKRNILAARFCLLLFFSAAAQGDDAKTRRSTILLEEPMANATGIANLPAKKSVKIIRRKGFWIEVLAEKKTGWIKISGLRFRADESFKGSLTSLKSGREGIENNVAATGARGLEASTIKLAKPNYKAFAKLKLVTINNELSEELGRIKTPRAIKNIAFQQPPKNVNSQLDQARKKLRPKPNFSLDVDDDF